MADQNSNFGTVFSWWDFCFKTYQRAPAAGHQHMSFGLPELDKRGLSALNLLALPFRKLAPNSTGRVDPRPAVVLRDGCEDQALTHGH
jgi:hypothetical protein